MATCDATSLLEARTFPPLLIEYLHCMRFCVKNDWRTMPEPNGLHLCLCRLATGLRDSATSPRLASTILTLCLGKGGCPRPNTSRTHLCRRRHLTVLPERRVKLQTMRHAASPVKTAEQPLVPWSSYDLLCSPRDFAVPRTGVPVADGVVARC